MKLQLNKKALGQALIVLLASVSFLGLSAATANADERNIEIAVDVIDSSIDDCTALTPYSWDPDPSPWYTGPNGTEIDLQFASVPQDFQIDFYVDLRFEEEIDSCGFPMGIPGNVEATFTDLASPLSLESLDCFDAPCSATDLLNSNNPSQLTGRVVVDPTAALGNYTANLKVIWVVD
jgi:hypothetical protein